MDISAPSPISAQATLAAHAPAREAPDVTTVTPSETVDNARTDPHTENGHGQNDRAAEARELLTHQRLLQDPSTPTGPSPTFQLTQLEVDQDLQNILARIEAARAQARDAQAIQIDTQADHSNATPAPSPQPTDPQDVADSTALKDPPDKDPAPPSAPEPTPPPAPPELEFDGNPPDQR